MKIEYDPRLDAMSIRPAAGADREGRLAPGLLCLAGVRMRSQFVPDAPACAGWGQMTVIDQ